MSVVASGRGRVPMLEVNPHVMCVLCGGYFIDATTIIECLHSFCRKCIVTYLESSRFCPICDVQVHKTKPLLSIRPDATLQDIVYKLVPGLYRDEMRRRREFYASRPASELPCERGEPRGEERRAVFAPDELLVVRLQYQYPSGPPCPGQQVRYLRCPAQVTVGHLQHMVSCKHELPPGRRVELLARGEVLTSDLMLLDVAYLHCWRRVGPLQLQYRIVAVPVKRSLTEVDSEPPRLTSDRLCRDLARVPNGGDAPPPPIIPAATSGVPPATQPAAQPAAGPAQTAWSHLAPAVDVKEEPPPGILPPVPPLVLPEVPPLVLPMKAESVTVPGVTAVTGVTGVTGGGLPADLTPPPSVPPQKGTEGAECKEVQLHISETGEMTFGNGPAAGGGPVDILQQACSILDSLETGEAEPVSVVSCQSLPVVSRVSSGVATSLPTPATPPAVKGPIRDSNKNEIGSESKPVRVSDDTGQKRPAKETTPSRPRPRIDGKRSSPVGYKTLKTPPKSWNPQLPRSYVGSGQKSAEPGRTVSPIAPKPPPRFFKMRHSSGAGGPPAEAARAPLLMRVDPPGLPPTVWSDQLLSPSPLTGSLSLYPHLYTAQPLPFLSGPAVSMFAPPPAHSGVSQLTYTSAPGSFSPLLAAPRPPVQRHLSPTSKSTSTNGGQKPALSAAGSATPMSASVSVSSAPVSTLSALSSAPDRPHISCSVPNSRPRPSERPPSAAPASAVSAPASAAAGSRLSLTAFLAQNTVTGPPGLLGTPYSVGAASRPIANGQTLTSPRSVANPQVAPLVPPPQPSATLRKETSNSGGSRSKDQPPPPPLPPPPNSGGGGKPALVSPAQALSGPTAALPMKAITETRLPAATAGMTAGVTAVNRPEKTAVTRR